MSDYFRNYSSNGHQVCCEDSPTKSLCDHCLSDDLDLDSRSQVRLKLDYFFNLQYLWQYLSYYIQTWYDGSLTHGVARFDDIELDLDFENVCKACHSYFLFFIFHSTMLVLLVINVRWVIAHLGNGEKKVTIWHVAYAFGDLAGDQMKDWLTFLMTRDWLLVP